LQMFQYIRDGKIEIIFMIIRWIFNDYVRDLFYYRLNILWSFVMLIHRFILTRIRDF
jgi:hypothetical protein